MRQELRDIAIELATKTAPAGGLAVWAQYLWEQVNVTALLTCALVVLQIIYLLRKWWREETEWGLRLRLWARRVRDAVTKPAELDD